MKEQPATAIEVSATTKGKRTASSRRRRALPPNPNKKTTTISADKSIARLKEENRAVIYGYRD